MLNDDTRNSRRSSSGARSRSACKTDEIFDRAVARGEADPDRLTPRVKSVAFDLLRNELLLTQRPVPRKVIDEIVDDVVLPLVCPRQ